jgi:hypothetical protein
VLRQIQQGQLPTQADYRERFLPPPPSVPDMTSRQHPLADYNQLLGYAVEAAYV